MENREKLENPIIEFTKVTLLDTSSSCDAPEYTDQDGHHAGLDEMWT